MAIMPRCSPRLSARACDAGRIDANRVLKSITVLFQCTAFFFWLRSARLPHPERALVNLATAVVLSFSALGAVHSVILAVASPDVSDLVPEFVYSMYEALLFGALGLLLRIWLEHYHAKAFPAARAVRESLVRPARAGAWAMLLIAGGIALLTDALIAADLVSFETGLLAQHAAFFSLCAVAGFAFWWLTRSVLAQSALAAEPALESQAAHHHETTAAGAAGWGQASSGEVGASPDLTSRSRLLVARFLSLALWAMCLVFCALCIALNVVSDPSDPGGSAVEYVAWLAHTSFVLVGGSIIAGLNFTLLHRPSLLDVSWLRRLALGRGRAVPVVSAEKQGAAGDGATARVSATPGMASPAGAATSSATSEVQAVSCV